jgi:HD-GYP domain-containing protein (c-di-GMP phosphodiesterase class II)/HAMP domain-containing protein
VKHGFLATRVGRRFLAVNLLTALVPVVIVAALSFAAVRVELREQATARVQRLSKSVGMTTLTYLASLHAKLLTAATDTAASKEFERVVKAEAGVGVPRGLATGVHRPLSQGEIAQLRDGRAVLLLAPSGREHRAILARAELPWTSVSRPVVWGVVRRATLFDEAEESARGEDAALCIFESGTFRRVMCEESLDEAVEDVAEQRARRGSTEADSTTPPGYFASARDVYLRHAYGAAEWRVVVMQPESASFAAAAQFRNNFLLLVLAVVVLIFGVSHAQIRRTTEPLAQLQDGTRRLEAGDFGTPVVVRGNDEYAEVAASFNGMASTLQRQLTLMQRLEAVDQAALGTRETTGVVDEALSCIAAVVHAGTVTIAIASQTDRTAMDAVTLDCASGQRTSARLILGHTTRDSLLANPRRYDIQDDSLMRRWLPDRCGTCVALPLVHEQELGGVILLSVPTQTIAAADWSEARRLADRVGLALSNVQLLTRLDALSAGTVLAFARAIDANSPWTAGHSERVTRVALVIGAQLQLSPSELDTLERGGLLHDIGKIAVPPAVLDKAGRLTDEEWAVMRRHPAVGCDILAPIPAFADALPIVRSHHERMDGTGYPDQLRGDDIPFLARVLAVADVFDALASDRPYRAGMTTDEACDIIWKGSGAHFDPAVVHAFMDAVRAGAIRAGSGAHDSDALAATVARARATTLQPA